MQSTINACNGDASFDFVLIDVYPDSHVAKMIYMIITLKKFFKVSARIAVIHLLSVLLVTVFTIPFPAGAMGFTLDVLLSPISLFWFPTHRTPIAEVCGAVLASSTIWGLVFGGTIWTFDSLRTEAP